MLAKLMLFSVALIVLAAAKPTPAPEAKPIKYLALGDSFTAGTGATPEQAFPSVLSEQWRKAGRDVTLKNVAVNGYTTQDLIDRELPVVAGFAPTVVTVAIGANDLFAGMSADYYQVQVRQILQRLKAKRVKHLIVLPQPDWSLSPAAGRVGDRQTIARKIEEFNRILAAEAERAHAHYVDLFAFMRLLQQKGEVAADGLHPSAEAYAAWGVELAKQLKSDE